LRFCEFALRFTLANMCSGPARNVLAVSCAGVTVFSFYCAALISIPCLWMIAVDMQRDAYSAGLKKTIRTLHWSRSGENRKAG
jgi:hypothetical protein